MGDLRLDEPCYRIPELLAVADKLSQAAEQFYAKNSEVMCRADAPADLKPSWSLTLLSAVFAAAIILSRILRPKSDKPHIN
jgi:hypothetical protein